MVRWGKVEVPELDQIPLLPGTQAPIAGHGLLAVGTTLHHPTGLRLTAYQSDWNDRNLYHEYYLTPPTGEDWRLQVVATDGYPTIRSRVRDHLGLTPNDPFHVSEPELTRQMLVTHGQVFDCVTAAPAPGDPPALWTVERRDGLVLMLFWALERLGRYNHCNSSTHRTSPLLWWGFDSRERVAVLVSRQCPRA